MKKGILFGFFIGLFIHQISAQSVTNIVKVDSLEIGQVIDYTLVVKKQETYESVAFPDSAEFAPSFSVRSKKVFRPNLGTDSVVYRLQFFGTESGFIPNVPVMFINKTDTSFSLADKVPYTFKTKVQREDAAPRPYKPIYDFALNIWPFILLGVILIVLIVLLARYIKNRPESEPVQEPIKIPPFINPLGVLEESLGNLRNSPLISEGNFKEFYVAMGDAVRRYYEDVYDFPALEETAREIHMSLESKMIDSQIIKESRVIFREADLVKFAKFEPTVDSAYQALEKAIQLKDLFHKMDKFKIERLKKLHEQKYSPNSDQEEGGMA